MTKVRNRVEAFLADQNALEVLTTFAQQLFLEGAKAEVEARCCALELLSSWIPYGWRQSHNRWSSNQAQVDESFTG